MANDANQTPKLSGWAIVELLGKHNKKYVGVVSEQRVGQAVFIRIDSPEQAGEEMRAENAFSVDGAHYAAGSRFLLKAKEAFTKMVNSTAIYSIHPLTEEQALDMAARIRPRKIVPLDPPCDPPAPLPTEGGL